MPDAANESQPLSAFKQDTARVTELAEIEEKAEMATFLKRSREEVENGETLPAGWPGLSLRNPGKPAESPRPAPRLP